MQSGPAEGSGADHQMDDVRPAGVDPGAGRAQSAAARGRRGREVLPAAGLSAGRPDGHRQRGHRRHEPGLLHPEPGHRLHGDLRQLHVQGAHPHRRGRPHLRPGHLCGPDGRADHLPRLLQLWGGAGSGSRSDFCDPAQGVYRYGRRPPVGQPVLPVHVLCQLHHRYRRV